VLDLGIWASLQSALDNAHLDGTETENISCSGWLK